ncbi:MAG: DUF2111 domain-containing protein [Methanomassiliicoccales archaeon]|nr:DUF2111 domain-containing protein [Methanomassiliicoccales archaeon]
MSFNSYFAGGPTPKFTAYHIWKAHQVVAKEGPIGRKALAEVLQIGEGSTRTILDKMTREGSVESSRLGITITDRGRRKLDNSGVEVRQVELSDLTLGKFNCAVLIKGAGSRVRLGCEQRDEAVRAGAVGATTLVVQKGRIVFPGDEEFPDQNLVAPLRNYFRMDDGDVIIIGSAFSYDAAEKGAVTAALSLGNLSKRCWNEGTNILSQDTESDELRCLALAIHELLERMPVTMRSRNHTGVRCEDGEVVDTVFTGPMLEEAMRKGAIVRRVSTSGPYRGLPVIAVPIMRKKEAIAAIATLDLGKGTPAELLTKLTKLRP